MVWEPIRINLDIVMKVIGSRIIVTVVEPTILKMETFLKEKSKKINFTAEESTTLEMVIDMKVTS